MPALPFEISRGDQAFLSGLETLRARSSPLTEDQAFKVFSAVARYLIGLTDEITRWWDKIEAGEVDMRYSATSFPVLILARCKRTPRDMSPQLAELSADLLTEDRPPEVKEAENVYFGILIDDIKSVAALQLAT